MLLLFLTSLVIVNADGSESQSLVFLSTGRVITESKFAFEQVTVFNDIIVSFCNGVTKKEQLKSRLQNSSMPLSCEKDHVNILEAINNIHTYMTVDVVQRMRGCSASSNGSVSAMETWAVNGQEFLTFDPDTSTWMSKSPSAVKIKELWDNQPMRSHDYRYFLKSKCPKMLQQITLKSTPKNTELHVFAKPLENNEAFLCCHVTTTDRSVKSVRLIGDGATHVSGFTVAGPLPTGGDAWVFRLRARISLSVTHLTYGCAVQSAGQNMSVFWNGNTLDGRHIYYSLWEKAVPAVIGFVSVIVKMKRRPPPPRIRPEIRDQFESFIESSTLYPDIRNYLLSFIYGSNTPESHRGDYNQWFEMMERQNNYDPEFYGGRRVAHSSDAVTLRRVTVRSYCPGSPVKAAGASREHRAGHGLNLGTHQSRAVPELMHNNSCPPLSCERSSITLTALAKSRILDRVDARLECRLQEIR
ncbi:hypothetical protein WMY93_016772 [Mugilogobius chulae]|uniref:MHC class I-like antigen recognition-like domain-containing protein n=1 Tax=Mugilogobius chulae TaxID=88201 RepID=A0AAW0NWH3_9GOBI